MRTVVLASSLTLALSSVALASPATPTSQTTTPAPTTVVRALTHAPVLPPGTTFKHRCSDETGAHGCKSLVAVDSKGQVLTSNAPVGFGAPDIQAAYHIDPALGDGVTVAVVDAFGYADLEADLAVYRSTYGLPECTTASGCLTIVNDNGLPSPLPADNEMWIGETALDVQMVSAACPKCKIVVVQSGADGGAGLDLGQLAASKLGVNSISDSWGSPESGGELQEEGSFNNAGIGTFVSSGDAGYTGATPAYPATSNFVISVGGTHMQIGGSGEYLEDAWSLAGSSCSLSLPKPSYQPVAAACNNRAASDVSAVADPATGVATYIAKQGKWQSVGGTSAASPIVAALFAGAGHGDATPAFVYKHIDVFKDITVGSNGNCGTNVCNAAGGWDGPTGIGSPDQSKLKAIGGVDGAGPDVTLTYPADGDTVTKNFTIEAVPADGALYVALEIDGVRVGALNKAPYDFSAPSALADGAHTIKVTAFDLDHNSKSTSISVTQAAAMMGGGGGGGCAAGGNGASGLLAALGLGAILVRRRKTA